MITQMLQLKIYFKIIDFLLTFFQIQFQLLIFTLCSILTQNQGGICESRDYRRIKKNVCGI